MYIFIDRINYGSCGKYAGFADSFGNKLYVGDIVLVHRKNESLEYVISCVIYFENKYSIHGLSGYARYSFELNGIFVKKVKSFMECLDNEHWKSTYSDFRYSETDNPNPVLVFHENDKIQFSGICGKCNEKINLKFQLS